MPEKDVTPDLLATVRADVDDLTAAATATGVAQAAIATAQADVAEVQDELTLAQQSVVDAQNAAVAAKATQDKSYAKLLADVEAMATNPTVPA